MVQYYFPIAIDVATMAQRRARAAATTVGMAVALLTIHTYMGPVGTAARTHAAIGIVAQHSVGVIAVIGQVSKHPGFLFNQTEPWEGNVNNGYPNVVCVSVRLRRRPAARCPFSLAVDVCLLWYGYGLI